MARGVDSAKVRAWRERLGRFDDGGTTVEKFCLMEGISQSSFYHWRRKLARSDRPSSSTRQRQGKMNKTAGRGVFEPVTIAAAVMVVMRLPGGTLIEVPAHSEQALRAIVGRLVAADIEAERC